MCFIKNKTIDLIYVTKAIKDISELTTDNILTVVANKTQAYEYIDKLFQRDKHEHYALWCINHNLEENTSSWLKYIKTVWNDLYDGYSVVTMKYSKDTIAMIYRLFLGCENMGCSFEKEIKNEIKDQ